MNEFHELRNYQEILSYDGLFLIKYYYYFFCSCRVLQIKKVENDKKKLNI